MGVPGNANALLLRSAAAAGGYQVSRSLRFNSSDSGYLSRTPSVAGNRKTWTWSGWVKRCATSPQTGLFAAGVDASNISVIYLASNGPIYYYDYVGGSMSTQLISSAVFRDFSGWMHIQVAVDTTQATAANRVRLYVNGLEITAFSTAIYPTQNADTFINTASTHTINKESDFYANYGNFYLAECHFVDGQQLAPSSFTEVSATTGQLIPKAYTGTFTGNSFWLKFADNSAATATTLGKDSSGLGNNWTPNNLSVTAGAGNDSLVDTPVSSGTDTGNGGEVRGNYCTWNPLDNGSVTLSNCNLDGSATVAWKNVRGTIAFPSSGKWYFEVTPGGSALLGVGIAAANKNLTDQSTGTFVTYNEDGRFYKDGSINASGKATYTSGDVIGVAFDCDTNSVTFYKNNVSQGSVTPTTGVSYFPFVQIYNSSLSANWGQRSWAYAAPSGFKALCDTNLPAPVVAKPNTVFDVIRYTGNGSTQTIPNVNTVPTTLGFSPDFVWLKSRSSGSYSHNIYDAVRGATKIIYSDSTSAENTDASGLTAFNSNGFNLGSTAATNASSTTYVAWCWDAGSDLNPTTNTAGSITSSVSVRANATAGFSVVTYTGTATNCTVGHGLGVAPDILIAKRRDSSGAWYVYHRTLGALTRLQLNETSAATVGTSFWNSTNPTSTVFSIGSDSQINANGGTFVVYAFAPVVGYSSFGSYTGNGSADGPFVYTGFRPRWVMIKNTSVAASWYIYDTSRDTYNLSTKILLANSSGAEYTDTDVQIDVLSNGFKLRSSGGQCNGSSSVMVYAAFAESPFNYARAR